MMLVGIGVIMAGLLTDAAHLMLIGAMLVLFAAFFVDPLTDDEE